MNYSFFVLGIYVLMIINACSGSHPAESEIKQPAHLNTLAKAEKKKSETTNPIAFKRNNKWALEKVSGSMLRFKNGKGLNTKLHNLKYIGQIDNGPDAPFFIYSGNSCLHCKEKPGLYVHSPSDTITELVRYHYPESLKATNGTILNKSRVFYGQILNDIKGLIWYTEMLTSEKKTITSVFYIGLNTGTKKNYLVKYANQDEETLKLVEKGWCREIK